MSVGATLETATSELVSMGQVRLVRSPETARAVLGSCIGLVLYHPRAQVGMLAHIVLPDSAGRDGPPAKFADTAIPYMVQELRIAGAALAGLKAKIIGGASMFGNSGPIQVGKANIDAVEEILAGERIPIVGRHIGGPKGRRIVFDSVTGDCIIEAVGDERVVL